MKLPQKFLHQNLKNYSFILPGFLIIALIVIYPILSTIVASFSEDGARFSFTLEKYIRVVNAPHFFEMLRNTVVWVITTVSLSFLVGFAAAVLVEHDSVKHKNIWRSIFLLAWVTPSVIKAEAWRWLFSYDFGMLNNALVSYGLISEPIPWLFDAKYAFFSIILVQIWGEFSYVMLMISAGMQSINKDYRDCALLDGAGWIRYIWSIVIPIIRDVVFIALLIITIWSINTFVMILIVTGGGPLGSTTILSLDVYQKFLMFDRGGAAATSIFQLLFCLIITIIYVQRSRKEAIA